MRKVIVSVFLAAFMFAAPALNAVEDDKAFVEKAKQAVGLLYNQDTQGGMVMRCTVTAFERNREPSDNGTFSYKFLSAAHCVGKDRTDKEHSASPNNIPFFISFDEGFGPKQFWPAQVLWVGYQSRGEDFSVYEVKSKQDWPVVEIGNENKLKDGAAYWNIASPLGLGRQTQEGIISSLDLDRPLIEGDINWSHTLVLQQSGVNGGSSGSAIISKETHAIVGTLVGTVGGSTIIAIPISRFIAVQKAVTAGKYKWWVPEVNMNPDGTID